MFWNFKSSTWFFCHIPRRKKRDERERENLFRPLWLTSFFWGCCFSTAHFLARAIWRQSATDFFFYMSFPLLPCSAFPLDTFAVFHFVFYLVSHWLFDCLFLFHFHVNSLRVPGRAAQPLRLHDDNANDETLHQRRVHGHFRRLGNLQPRPSQRIPMELSRLFIFISFVVVYSFAHHRGAFRNFSRRPFSLSLARTHIMHTVCLRCISFSGLISLYKSALTWYRPPQVLLGYKQRGHHSRAIFPLLV